MKTLFLVAFVFLGILAKAQNEPKFKHYHDSLMKAQKAQNLSRYQNDLNAFQFQLTDDNAQLKNAEAYHPLRTPEEKNRDISKYSSRVQRDKENIRKSQDSIAKYSK